MSKQLYIVVLFFSLFWGSKLYAQTYQAQWEKLVDGEGKMDETGFKILSDEDGFLYVLGTSMNNGEQIFLSKYTTDGEFIWGKYPASGSSPKDIQLIRGLIYIGFYTLNSNKKYESVVLAYDKNGELISRYTTTNDVADGYYYLNSFVVDDKDNVYIAGRYDPNDRGIYYAFITKITKTGKKEVIIIKGGANSSKDSEYTALAMDKEGNTYVSGNYSNHVTNSDAVLMKISPDRKIIWEKSFDLNYNYELSDFLLLTTSGKLYQGGYSSTYEGDWSLFINQYDQDGQLNWTRTYDPPGKTKFADFWFEMDAAENLYVACSNDHILSSDSVALFKYNVKGELQWITQLEHADPLAYYIPGFQLKVGKNRLYLITSHSYHKENDQSAMLSIYDLNGKMVSSFSYNSIYLHDDEFKSIIENKNGDVYILGVVDRGAKEYIDGYIKIGIGGNDLLLLKLSPQ